MAHAVVFVPGILGSELWVGRDRVWPGSVQSYLFGYDDMDRLLDPGLEPRDLIRSYSVSKQYRSLVEDLNTCDFREDSDPRTLYAFPYDWRKDNREAAGRLADLLDRAVADGGATEITLIGHSMGGLICRYYLESGRFADRDGLKAVRRLITLGTPHRGAPLALSAALGLEGRLFLSAPQVRRIANDPRYPSLYQLLPPPGEPFVWNDEAGAEFSDVDVYDPAVGAALGLLPDNVEAAREFHAALDPARRPLHGGKPIRYFFFTGTHQTTVSAVRLLEMQPGRYRVRRWEQERAGDGTVPAWSGALTGVQGQPVGGEHSTIYRNDVLRSTMAALLGKKGVLAGEPARVEVSLRERVAAPGQAVHVSLGFLMSTASLDGALVVQPVLVGADDAVTYAPPVATYQLNYNGPQTESINVVFNAPALPDVYRVAYVPASQTDPAGSDELFVQQV